MDDEIEFANNIITICCALLLFFGLWCFLPWQYAAVIAVFLGMAIEFALDSENTWQDRIQRRRDVDRCEDRCEFAADDKTDLTNGGV